MTVRPGPKPRLGADPRERLYEAALRCFDRAGFAATSMGDIAAEAGVSRPLIYRHFADKPAIVLEVVVRHAKLILDDIGDRTAELHGLDRVIAAAALGIHASRENPHVRAITTGDTGPVTTELLRHDRFRDLERNFWTPLLTDAHAAGELRDDRPFDELIDWIVFQQLALTANAQALNLGPADVDHYLHTYLRPALATGQLVEGPLAGDVDRPLT